MEAGKSVTVWGDKRSGNCYKVQLVLEQLQIPYDWQHVDIMNNETHTSQFLEKNPNGKIPVIQLPNGKFLFESNAIIAYFAEGTFLSSGDKFERAQILQWLFFEQYSHEPFIAVSRFIVKYLGAPPDQERKLASRREGGLKALRVMNQHLQDNAFFVGQTYSIADIALFAYTHVADEGRFDLTEFPAILDWLERVKSQPYFIPMGV